MLRRTTIILPAADSRWEVWRSGGRGGTVWLGSAEDLKPGPHNNGAVVVALPARSCRTFSFSVPTEDRQLVRKLAFAQLEKRGLTTSTVDQTPFDCHVVSQSGGRSLVSVDVVAPEATDSLAESRASAVMPGARLFHIPEGKLVVMEEQGRLVLCAGADGRLIHSQIVSATRDLNGHAAPEIRIASLALQQQGVLPEVAGIELWGDFSAGDAHELGEQLGLPVSARARPAPDNAILRREASIRLLPPAARQAMQRRRFLPLRWLAPVALVLPVLWWGFSRFRELRALEKQAAGLENSLASSVDPADKSEQDKIRAEHEAVNAAQARWNGLRLALEPRRYPLTHLDRLTRCLTAADAVLTRFESKVSEVSITGAAKSAMDAYNFFNAVNADKGLSVYAWSMVQPAIGTNGSATFEIKGQMR